MTRVFISGGMWTSKQVQTTALLCIRLRFEVTATIAMPPMLPRPAGFASLKAGPSRLSFGPVMPAQTRKRYNSSLDDSSPTGEQPELAQSSPKTFYKITLLRSAISLGSRKKGTLESLGIHRRMQTVFHPHSPEFAGKILAVKELVKVENVAKEDVMTKTEQRRSRKASRGYSVVGRLEDRNLGSYGVFLKLPRPFLCPDSCILFALTA